MTMQTENRPTKNLSVGTAATADPRRVGVLAREEDAAVKGQEFYPAPDYQCFRAQYAFRGDDIVIQLFLPHDLWDIIVAYFEDNATHAERYRNISDFWLKTAGEHIDRIAQMFFKQTSPDLAAAYTEEVNSWWIRSAGKAHASAAPHAYVCSFLSKLDASLHSSRISLLRAVYFLISYEDKNACTYRLNAAVVVLAITPDNPNTTSSSPLSLSVTHNFPVNTSGFAR